jgi:hypothetical protein
MLIYKHCIRPTMVKCLAKAAKREPCLNLQLLQTYPTKQCHQGECRAGEGGD